MTATDTGAGPATDAVRAISMPGDPRRTDTAGIAGEFALVDGFDFSVGAETYGLKQDRNGANAASYEDDGGTLRLSGNTWKKFDLPGAETTIEAGTVLRVTLDVLGDRIGKFHAIGLDVDDTPYNGNEAIFQLAGSETYASFSQDYRGRITAEGGAVTYEIDLSAFAGQSFTDLVVVNDDDKLTGVESLWSAVEIVQGTPAPPPNVAPTTTAIDAGRVNEADAPVVIDLLRNARDADGDPLAVRGVTVTDGRGGDVDFRLEGSELTIDPRQFAPDLDGGDRLDLRIAYEVDDGRGGVTPGRALLEVTGIGDSYVSGDRGAYNVEVIFVGSWTEALRGAFVAAAEAISDIVLGDIPDTTDRAGVAIDDIRIDAVLEDIDGRGGVLGSAGPRELRGGSLLPKTGQMRFDTADAESLLSRGLWEDVIFHEMMHTLGVGTLWERMGLVTDVGGDLRFNGENARAAYEAYFPEIFARDARADIGVPIETDGGPGTAGGHWDEDTFGSEIMTGYVDWTNFLSDMTVASLEDMGYQTGWEPPIA